MDSITTDFENWGPYLMKQFQQMYDKGERCDLEISCNKQIFLVHRLILAACSEYVRDLGDKQHIILPDEVSCKALKSIIDFVYTGKIIYCKDDKEDLLLASNLLHMRLLTELIKMEESCSFTLSMDDENEESKSSENTNHNVSLDLNESTDLSIDHRTSEQPTASQTVKRKEVRSGRPRGSKSTVLPPLFKFPYLQHKFSSNRSYGLITILTDFLPSRLDVPEAILQSCPFQSSFDDISYGTSILCSYDSMNAPLEPVHHQFLKKIRESPQKRSFASALFSPFDKYTPPYNMSSEMHAPKKRESVTSYLSSNSNNGAPAHKRPALKTSQTAKKSVTFAKELEVIVECPRSYSCESPRRTPIQPPIPVEIPKPLPKSLETTAAIDVSLETAPCDIDMELPAPLSPVANISDDLIHASFVESGEKVELTDLRNVAMPMDIEELDHPSVIEYHPEPSVDESVPADKLSTCEDITMVDANEVEMIQKDVPTATNEARTMSIADYTAADFATIEQGCETEEQNAITLTSLEISTPDVDVANTVAETSAAAAADENETEVEMMPVASNELQLVNVTEHSIMSDAGTSQQNFSVIDVSTKTTAKNVSADVSLAQTTCSSVTAASPAEITEQNLTNIDSICEKSSKELSSSATKCTSKTPLTDEPGPVQQQVAPPGNSTNITLQKIPTKHEEPDATVVSSNSSNIPPPVISAATSKVTVSSNVSSISNSSEVIILPNVIEKPTDNGNSSAPSTSSSCKNVAAESKSANSTTCSEKVISSDSTVFTALDTKQMSQICTEPNSQMFAIKVKGTENPTQLSQLVDLCRQNPLFKNKNVKFKIVPVKGPITKTLQEHAQLSSNLLSKAIIVQKSPNIKSGNAQDEKANTRVANTAVTYPATKTAAAKTAAVKTAATKTAALKTTAAKTAITRTTVTKVVSSPTNKRPSRTQSLENVDGPWKCGSCHEEGSSLPLKLNSYFEYRTHLHEVHNEPNNPVFCIHCGYKSLKRNQQLYHLLSKHQIEPPSNFQFPKCDKCDFYALNEYSLQKHQSTHQTSGMEYVCSCREAFKTSDLLQQHMTSNVCKNSSSFSCGYCNSQFGRVVNLKAHMRVCMKERAKQTPPSAPVVEPVRSSEEEDLETMLSA